MATCEDTLNSISSNVTNLSSDISELSVLVDDHTQTLADLRTDISNISSDTEISDIKISLLKIETFLGLNVEVV